MSSSPPTFALARAEELLGYLNFSSGATDPQFLRGLGDLWREIEGAGPERNDAWRIAQIALLARLGELERTSPAFRDATQARRLLTILGDYFIPTYRQWHQDLLSHQSDGSLWRPFMIGRAAEAILLEGAPWDETDRIVAGAVTRLSDFIGHRPVAVLRTNQRLEPYRHEFVRPIPLYIKGAGVAPGRYAALVAGALDILRATDAGLLADAYMHPDLMDELALDPRAYDFDHPVNKRPNYQLGQWDPHHLDGQGHYRRFVLQQITLDGLLDRIEHPGARDPKELLAKASAVLCGTMLMGSGISGAGPESHDSTVTLATLLPRIAEYRDQFYKRLLENWPAAHKEQLLAEATSGRQPLAAARQGLNHYLARRRAAQLEHVHLAILYARMGFPAAARRQTSVVATPSARMTTEIQCLLTTGALALEAEDVAQAVALLPAITDLLHRAVECGALVDPWNILGFQGQFSLFAAPENSVPDHRVDALIELLEQIFSLHARAWAEAAARSDSALEAEVSKSMLALSTWWDQFAATTVDSVEAFSGADAYASAKRVAGALAAWHQGGAATGDIGFWRNHAQNFHSPKAYALVVDALLDKQDFDAARALLIQWLSQSSEAPLVEGRYSLHALARRWLDEVREHRPDPAMVEKFFDYIEANAEEYWQAPRLGHSRAAARDEDPFADAEEDDDEDEDDDEEGEEGADEEGVFHAAYDEMVYTDSTDDGVDSEMMEAGGAAPGDFALEADAKPLRDRMMMLALVAELWRTAATMFDRQGPGLSRDALAGWLRQAELNRRQLLDLVDAVSREPLPAGATSRDSLLEFERRRSLKESLLEGIIAATVATTSTARLLRAISGRPAEAEAAATRPLWEAILAQDAPAAREAFPALLADLKERKLLYIPLARGGDPRAIVAARDVQQSLREFLAVLPRLGLFAEACQLIAAARRMEVANPVGPGAVSEFDRLFELGSRAMIESLIAVSNDWKSTAHKITARQAEIDGALVECLEQLTEGLLKQWLAHSRTLRLSVLEKIGDERTWTGLVDFITRFGKDLFTQRFLNLGNLRAILHQGVENWLARLERDPEAAEEFSFLPLLGNKLDRGEAVKYLGLAIEAVAENYAEYRDYNSTTTQSDRGELLYMFLDFLRLRVQYDRVAWHLRPVLLAHEILVRRGRSDAAELWRRSLAERTSEVADRLQHRLAELEQKYGMRLPSITDRLAERFVRPLSVDRARAAIGPAMAEVRDGDASPAFQSLEQEIGELSHEPTGSGHDAPAWLRALEEEVDEIHDRSDHETNDPQRQRLIPQAPLTLADVQRELAGWEDLALEGE